ncbi:hypothetical protein ZOD2009_00205 [Haladaptatus paucihalophilus DX253]|uniref:Uncharacterized membrane protein n=1 Tax=Haladaptatus paucihalophilus DX253 TaxID=797209 RepID=E7QMM5_HALPU|nr:DUF502 domain-containing protein [Haladaptatus paucihalophilus]EFW94209.1 hypothetical protein ZOD2009_00205 [Haladaptatus paucihalophilus DX253]SHL33740.1 Uncharacterized membrane protein [Haladaptatus paucihalophilus DX253]
MNKNVTHHNAKEIIRRSLISGAAIAIPLIVTVVVLGFVLNFISNTLNPVVFIVKSVPGVSPGTNELLVKLIMIGLLGGSLFMLGFVAEYRSGYGRVGVQFDHFMSSVPGIGSVYTSFNEMSELLLDSDSESFKEVKLVEYPTDGSYAVAFKTADTATTVKQAMDHAEMETLFLPMAPNPVMGGFVIHVRKDRVFDVEMTVEEGIRSIVTSGVVLGEKRTHALSSDRLQELCQNVSSDVTKPSPAMQQDETKRVAYYEASMSPENKETPTDLVEHAENTGDNFSTRTGYSAE